jgi:ribonuclease VapC
MMAIDSSALVAVALGEDEAVSFSSIMSEHRCYVGWPTLFETYLALHHRVDQLFARNFLHLLISRSKVDVIAFDERLFEIACAAFDRYGKGQGPGGLNFGDCLSYAVAKFHDVPLLFKGDDFTLTDIRSATS